VLTREHDDELVMGLVEKAPEKPSPNREAYLRETCGDNSELFERVWHYIESEERMHGFLVDPRHSTLKASKTFPARPTSPPLPDVT